MNNRTKEKQLFTLFENQSSEDKNKDGPTLQFELATGRRLAEARERHNLSIREVADELYLSEDIIKAIEARDYSAMPSVAYATGYVRAYAGLVNLDADQLIKSDPDLGLIAINDEFGANHGHGRPHLLGNSDLIDWRWISLSIKVLAVLIIAGSLYLGWNYRNEIGSWWKEKIIADKIEQIEEESNPQTLTPFQPLYRQT